MFRGQVKEGSALCFPVKDNNRNSQKLEEGTQSSEKRAPCCVQCSLIFWQFVGKLGPDQFWFRSMSSEISKSQKACVMCIYLFISHPPVQLRHKVAPNITRPFSILLGWAESLWWFTLFTQQGSVVEVGIHTQVSQNHSPASYPLHHAGCTWPSEPVS